MALKIIKKEGERRRKNYVKRKFGKYKMLLRGRLVLHKVHFV